MATCRVGWRSLGISLAPGKVCRAQLTLQDPWSYQLKVQDMVVNGHTVKPLMPYTAQVGINLTLEDPLRSTVIRARILKWAFSSGQQHHDALSNLWNEARPCYRFITTHFAYDENGPFYGSVQSGCSLSLAVGGLEPDRADLVLRYLRQRIKCRYRKQVRWRLPPVKR